MIKIISGTYGHLIGGRVRLMTAASDPFSLPPEQETRLVERGIAVYVNEASAEAEASTGFDNTPDLPEGVVGIPEYSTRNTVKELQEIAALCGITFEEGMTKAQMVELLDQHIAENAVEADPEDAPTFDAAEAVQ